MRNRSVTHAGTRRVLAAASQRFPIFLHRTYPILQKLAHPHILKIYDIISDAEYMFVKQCFYGLSALLL